MIMSNNAGVWFLTGSQGLYGPETLAQVEQQSRVIVDQLNDAGTLSVPVEWQPVLTDSSAIHQIIMAANADPDCIGLIAWMHTFSPAKMWITGLDALKTPFLHLHTQANVSLPWAEIDMDFMNLNQAAHGDREFGYIQTRLGVPRATIAGHVSDPTTQARIAGWQRAARGVAAIRSLRLARFGDNMRNVAVTEGDKVEAERRFGVSVNTYGVNDLVERVDAVAEAEVDELLEQYDDAYEIAPELRSGGDRHDSLRYSAKIEQGLRSFLSEGGFGAFTTSFEDLGGLRQLPGMAVQRLMAEGYGFGGEGDWKTSVMLHTIKAIGAGAPGGTSFMEDYTYHLGPGTPKILGAHMLEVCPTIAGDQAAGRDPPARHRQSRGPGPDGFRRGSGAGYGPGHLRSGRPVPPRAQRGRRGPSERAAAQAAGGPSGVGAEAGSGDLGRVLDHRRRTAPHGAVDRGRHGSARRLRQPARRRAVDHRRLDQPAGLRRPDPVEPGLLPPGPGVLDDGRAGDRTGIDQDQGRADRSGPRTDRRRQSRLGEPVRRPALDLLAGRRSGPAFNSATPPSPQDVRDRHGVELTSVGALGVSAMMHGYLAFDSDGELLTPFRTWRNTNTGEAAERLSEAFGYNIPHRWSVAHLFQAILNGEDHVGRIGHLTTLAGYVHWQLTGEKVIGIGDASGMFPIDIATGGYDARMLAQFDELAEESGADLQVGRPAAHDPGGRGAGRRAHRSGARSCSTRPDSCGPAPRCALPRATPGPAWWPPTRSLRAPGT